ncbi:MAG TPA: hypothetical protein VFY66_14305 [Anaerolineales bacterium]|nr:hypothetical protein [Anaerolineales bacterium]
MKRFSTLITVLMITLILSACGARSAQATPPPTIDALDLQSTVAAAAFTMLAETQTAIPTATLTATPTDTPVPTVTLPPLPTLDATFTAAPNANSGGGDPCINAVLPATLVGTPVKIRINNTTKAALSFSIYLNQTTPQGKCGYRAYTIDPGQALVLNDMVEGCVTLWAWNPDPEEYFIVTNGAATCIDDSLDTWVFDITTSSLKLR